MGRVAGWGGPREPLVLTGVSGQVQGAAELLGTGA